MKIRRQTKLYVCFGCKENYLHDDAHNHVLHLCPERPAAIKQRLLEAGKRYEPACERMMKKQPSNDGATR